MNSGKLIPRIYLLFGIVLMLFGLMLCVAYLLEAVIKRMGEGDQSLVFWYLPFLLFGVISMLSGYGLITRSRNRSDGND